VAAERREDVRLAGSFQTLAALALVFAAELELTRVAFEPRARDERSEQPVVVTKLAERCIVFLPHSPCVVELAARDVDVSLRRSRGPSESRVALCFACQVASPRLDLVRVRGPIRQGDVQVENHLPLCVVVAGAAGVHERALERLRASGPVA